MITVRCVGGIVHDESGRLLLIRRGRAPSRGRWSVPGGRVEAGETDTAAVIRELREETGLEVRPRRLVGTITRQQYEIFDYLCTVEGGRLHPGDDADDARWVDSAALSALWHAGKLTDGLAETLRTWDALPRV